MWPVAWYNKALLYTLTLSLEMTAKTLGETAELLCCAEGTLVHIKRAIYQK